MLRNVELVRGVASLLVLFYHINAVMRLNIGRVAFLDIFAFGDRGVDLFFVLSGFIITFVHAKDVGLPGKVGPFLLKRAIRLYPPVIAVAMIVLTLSFLGVMSRGANMGAAFSSLTLFPIDSPPFPGVTWTLRHEMMFYIYFALCIRCPKLFVAPGLLFAIYTSFSWIIFTPENFYFKMFLSPYTFEFFCGVLCAFIVGKMSATSAPHFVNGCGFAAGSALFGVAMFLLAGAFTVRMGLSKAYALDYISIGATAGTIPFAISSFIILFSASRLDMLGLSISNPVLLLLGRISFGLYLLHLPVIAATIKAFEYVSNWNDKIIDPSLLFLVASVNSIVVAILFYYGFERSVTKSLRNRFLNG